MTTTAETLLEIRHLVCTFRTADGPARAVDDVSFSIMKGETLGVVVVFTTLQIPSFIMLESFLSYLGLGVQAPTPSWGSMVFEGREVLLSAWWTSAFPGLAIVGAVVSCNLLGDGLRDALDVRMG